MKKLKVLVCMLSLMSLAVLTACDDDDDDNGRNGDPDPTNGTPTALTGQRMTATVTQTSGEAFFVPVGETYTVDFGTTDYTFVHNEDTFTGTYTYERAAGATTATLIFDPGTENQVDSTLTFNADNTSGTIASTGAGGSSETATFTLTGP